MAEVKYQVATYSGTIQVSCSCEDSDEEIKAKARNILRRQCGGHLPYGYESYTIISRP